MRNPHQVRPGPPMRLPRLLFCLKQREGYWGGYDLSSGLLNSVTFIVQMLNSIGIEATMVTLADNNGIDAAVKAANPTHVIIEAFWVVPTKFDVLMKLYPHVNWSVRDHSETPFIAQEGIAIEWIYGYLTRGIEIMCNSPRAVVDLQAMAMAFGGYQSLISYAPNVYPIGPVPHNIELPYKDADDTIRVGCFGAIRPLKNQLMQAVAALRFAYFLGRKLEFHINSSRLEPPISGQVVKNLSALLNNSHRATLVQHPWMDHTGFLTLVSSMDFMMQCSFSETFNIVSADAVGAGVPVIASPEVIWLGPYAWCNPNDSTSILENMIACNMQIKGRDQNNRLIWQWRDLQNYVQQSTEQWRRRFGPGRR